MRHYVNILFDLKNLKKIRIIKLIKIEMSGLLHFKDDAYRLQKMCQKITLFHFELTQYQY